MLDSDAAWFTPENIHEYQEGAAVSDEPILPPVIASNGRDHPPLSSPEPDISSQPVQRMDSQFNTQAPPMMDESQFRSMKSKPQESVVNDESEENPYEWEATQEPTSQSRSHQVDSATQNSYIEQKESENPLEWEESPPRPARTTKAV
jgi:hypothetical protein